jgi:hypothetical protein
MEKVLLKKKTRIEKKVEVAKDDIDEQYLTGDD